MRKAGESAGDPAEQEEMSVIVGQELDAQVVQDPHLAQEGDVRPQSLVLAYHEAWKTQGFIGSTETFTWRMTKTVWHWWTQTTSCPRKLMRESIRRRSRSTVYPFLTGSFPSQRANLLRKTFEIESTRTVLGTCLEEDAGSVP